MYLGLDSVHRQPSHVTSRVQLLAENHPCYRHSMGRAGALSLPRLRRYHILHVGVEEHPMSKPLLVAQTRLVLRVFLVRNRRSLPAPLSNCSSRKKPSTVHGPRPTVHGPCSSSSSFTTPPSFATSSFDAALSNMHLMQQIESCGLRANTRNIPGQPPTRACSSVCCSRCLTYISSKGRLGPRTGLLCRARQFKF